MTTRGSRGRRSPRSQKDPGSRTTRASSSSATQAPAKRCSRPPSGSVPASKDGESNSSPSPRSRTNSKKLFARDELSRVIARYARIDVLLLDELGYLRLPDGAAELVFQVLSERHERASLIITTNLPFGEWTKVFPDARLAKAVVDRLTHRAHIIDTGTESWRFRHGLHNNDN